MRWSMRTHLTRPDVFFRTVAANSCETPTRLTPSTSTIWSFTWILKRTHRRTSHVIRATLHQPYKQTRCWNAPSILLCRSSLSDGLDKDSQFFQSLVGSYTHSYDADAQTVFTYGGGGGGVIHLENEQWGEELCVIETNKISEEKRENTS